MDENSVLFSEELKNEVQQVLMEKITSNLENKHINLIQMKESANFILDGIAQVKNYSQLVVFLEALQAKWPIFKDSYFLYKNRYFQEKEKQVIDRLSSYIKHIS